jgi:hypothetical protein
MQAQTVKVKPKTKISYYEICCEVCNLSQFYRGKELPRAERQGLTGRSSMRHLGNDESGEPASHS